MQLLNLEFHRRNETETHNGDASGQNIIFYIVTSGP